MAELVTAGRQDSASGTAALILAARIDAGMAEAGSSVAALAREHRAALADAVQDAVPVVDPQENELGRARARRRALSGG